MLNKDSLGTIGTGTIITNLTGQVSHVNMPKSKKYVNTFRGQFLWTGHLGVITKQVLLIPWHIWWQTLVLISIIYKFILDLLLVYYLNKSRMGFDASLIIVELIFLSDVCLHLLHANWPLVRIYIRVKRTNLILLGYDILSLIPLQFIFRNKTKFKTVWIIGKWFGCGRIYRLYTFFQGIKDTMRSSRKIIYILEHVISVSLILHAGTCLWYYFYQPPANEKEWYKLGYGPHLNTQSLQFNTYLSCWYYCACQLFNVIFGDAFPLHSQEKLLTSFLRIFGFVFIRYRFIGNVAWEMVLKNRRWFQFVDRYHHMLNFLRFRGIPSSLIEQAKKYKLLVWQMKDGIVNSTYLKQLPLPLQMELIFDINVGHFHETIIFRDTDEAFMRSTSLLMRHEIYLAGQQVWSQGVVKNGMIWIKRGVVELLSDEDDESPMIAFQKGTVLGEICLLYSIPAKVTIKAATYVELQVLRRTDFLRAMVENPSKINQIRHQIENRILSSKRKQETITNYDKNDSRLIRTRYRPMKILKEKLAGLDEEDPTFVDDSHLYYRDERNARHRKFITDYLELYQICDNVTTMDAPRICLRARFPWILEPNTDFTHMFDLAHFMMVLFICIMSPLSAIRGYQEDWEKVLNTVVMTGLLLNIYVQLTTAVVEKNRVKATIKEIAEAKMATVGFYLDVISVFPIYIFTDTLDPAKESLFSVIVMIVPVFQVWHIWDYLEKWEWNFNTNVKLLCVLKYTLLVSIFCYWSGCLLFLLACPKQSCKEGSWMAQLIYWETKVHMVNEAKHEHAMTSSLLFGTSIFTGSGSSDLAPGSADLILVVLLLIVGTYLSCFYIAKVCSIYLLLTKRKLRFKETMRELFYFLSVNHVSGKIKARVKKFFCVQWYYNNAVSTEEILENMSPNIEQEILSLEMVETLLYCPLFSQCSQDFLQMIASKATTIVLPENEVVQHAGDIGRDMYILQKGHCNELDNYGKVIDSLAPGSHFGVLEMLYGLPKVYTVITSTNCVLLHLEYRLLVQCWSIYPDISHTITTVLEEPEILRKAAQYEMAKPITGRLDTKTNRIAQEIKESFIVITGQEEREHYNKTFDKLGILRYIRYIFLPVCITPHGLFLKFWCVLRFLMAAYYIISVPYNIATKQYKFGGSYYWADVFLYVDILFMGYVAYYDERSLLVTHPMLTVTNYIRHAFALDILSIFPFEQLSKIVNDHSDTDAYRLNRMLLVTRILGAFAYWENDIMRDNKAVVLIKYIPLAITLANSATALIFINSCVPFVEPDSYYVKVNCTRAVIVSSKNYEIKYAALEYINAFYWVIEVFVGCGCTPVSVSNNVNVTLTMLLQITGFIYFAFMFGYVASTQSAAAQALLEHTEKTNDLANFLFQENVDPLLTLKTLKYFEYVWKRTNGSNPQQICRGLNSALMEDTLVFMYEKALREVPLFGRVERSFIRVITQHLSELYFLKGDTVIQCKDMLTKIYIIYRGKVDVLSTYNEMITCMGPGGMFGNFTGQPISSSDVSIYASRNLDLLVIPCQTFFNLVKYYPKIQEPLHKAFEVSKDYILPITMDATSDDESSDDSDLDLQSQDSAIDSRSGSSRFEITVGQMSLSSSHSNVSQSKSSSSVSTYQSYANFSNLFKPGSLLFQAFGYFTCFMATANYVLVLYELVTLNDCSAIFWVQSGFDIFFYAKTYLNMHQGYINRHGELITNLSKCRRRYFKHKLWLWIDIVCNFPLELFGFCFSKPVKAVHYLRANKIFRLKHIYEFYRKTSAELTNNLTILQSVITILMVIIFLHTFSCIWLITMIATSPFSIIRTLKSHLIDEDTPQNRWDYTTSLYIIISELTATGGDEFLISKIFSKVILAICLICGKMLAGIVIAASMQVAYSTKYALNCYEKETEELILLLKNQGLSNYQLKKFRNYIRQLWVTERGRQLPALLDITPYSLRCDLMTAMFSHHLRNCYLFADTGEPFLRQLSAVLDYTIFFPGNYIVVAGDSEARMYWVASGTVSVVSVRSDLTETTHELLGAGDVFGILQGLDRGVSHCFSYRAETKVGILTLSLETWINILPFFPDAQRIISERAEILFAQL